MNVKSNPKRLRSVAIAALAVVLSGCSSSGCSSRAPEYPAEIDFEPRADRLVLSIPPVEPTGFGNPELWDADIAGLDALGGKTFDPKSIANEHLESLKTYLSETFHKPGEPCIGGASESTANAERLGLASGALKEGGRLYFQKCVQCHGVNGDGRGPTGLWINPHPRDFRQGKFKFTTTGDGGKPRRSDLMRTIRDGLKGTAMPGFALLPESERDLLTSYVMYLSIRGEVEFRTLEAMAKEAAGDFEIDTDPTSKLAAILQAWEHAERAPPAPTDPFPDDDATKQSLSYHDSIRRGYEMVVSPASLNCIACHQDLGRKPTYRYDVWGTVVKPANLTEVTLKGGSSPESLYWRIRGGIQSVGMPAHPTLPDSQVWDVVHFVRALPYRVQLPDDVRAKVYPE